MKTFQNNRPHPGGNGIGGRMGGARAKIRARLAASERDGGSEIVQTVIVLGVALGLGAALLLLQINIQTVLKDAGEALITFFGNITAGMG